MSRSQERSRRARRPTGTPRPRDGEASAGAMLVLAAFLWGSTFLVVKDATEQAEPVPFLAARFLLGAAVLAPLALRRRRRGEDEVRHGVVAGIAFLGGYLFQTIGLQYTTASSSAFVTYLLVVFVPLLEAVLRRRPPSLTTAVGVALAVLGLLLLSGGPEGIGKGELLTLAAALCFAVHLVILGRVAVHNDPVRLTFWQVLTVGLCCLLPGLVTGGYDLPADAWWAAAFTGVGPTAVAVLCMVSAQRVLPPARTAVLLLLEPVFAALLGYVVGERLGVEGLVGAGLILVAVAVTELTPALSNRPVEPHHADV